MRAVTVRQPWAWAIAHGFKDIENRSWAPRLDPGEVIAVHAGAATPSFEDVERVKKLVGRRGQVPDAFDCGCVVAVARYQGVVAASRSRWFSGPLGWVLGGARALREPVDCKGQLGLWRLPSPVESRVLRGLGRRPRATGSRGKRP
jgi:hypothetical protein